MDYTQQVKHINTAWCCAFSLFYRPLILSCSRPNLHAVKKTPDGSYILKASKMVLIKG